jgi:TolA-binding protein
MKPELESDAWVDALRADLPDEHDQARVAARLAGLGVFSAGALSTASASAVTSAAATSSGLVARWGALSWAGKIGVSASLSSLAVGGALALNQAHVAGASHPAVTDPASSLRADGARVRDISRAGSSTGRREIEAARPSTPAIPRAVTASAPDTRTAVPLVITSDRASPVAAAAVVNSGSELSSLGSASTPIGVAQFGATPASASSALEPQAAVSPAAPSTTLHEETTLIDAALGALHSGNRALAARLIAEHQRRFPNGLLVEERERARAKLTALH